jgi:hypothetical protein
MSKFKVGDAVRVLVDNPHSAPVLAGQEGIVRSYAHDTYNVEMSNGKRWAFLEKSLELAEFLPSYSGVNLSGEVLEPGDVLYVPGEVGTVLRQDMARITTLPTDSMERKNYPMLSGCLKYFPAALASISKISKAGNDKHNPGQPLHHARSKSTDHGDCIVRHLTDTEELLAALSRDNSNVTPEQVLVEASQLAWRALAYSQVLHEKFGSPLAPAAVDDNSKQTHTEKN